MTRGRRLPEVKYEFHPPHLGIPFCEEYFNIFKAGQYSAGLCPEATLS